MDCRCKTLTKHGGMAYRKKQSGSETRKRTSIVGFRATDAERGQIKRAALRAGLTEGSYVRSRALAKPTTRAVRRPPVETVLLSQLLGQLGSVAGTLRVVVERQRRDDPITVVELHAIQAAFQSAAAAIFQNLGRPTP